VACKRDPEATDGPAEAAPLTTVLVAQGSEHSRPASAPQQLYLPDASLQAEDDSIRITRVDRTCPPEMVNIRGQFCIDRFEATFVDLKQKRRISPYYHPNVVHTKANYQRWLEMRFTMGEPEYQNLPLPIPPPFQMKEAFEVEARSEPNTIPQGYLSGVIAEAACRNANKRLCSEEEWVTACRGEADTTFPYGNVFEARKCNVFNGAHPALILHGNASLGHLDPRLNYFKHGGRALLHPTGSNAECASRWNEDAVYDMVGNVDEWIADEEGTFLGGFYARNTKEGCLSKITAHPKPYFDYSLGVRCCL
jgi:formylglycine-generating enzyme required for sulfatase activity